MSKKIKKIYKKNLSTINKIKIQKMMMKYTTGPKKIKIIKSPKNHPKILTKKTLNNQIILIKILIKTQKKIKIKLN